MDELRTAIDQLDTQAGNVIEMIEDTSLQFENDNVRDLYDALQEIQGKITEFQQAEGWLN